MSLETWEPRLDTSLGLDSFNMACQQMSPVVTCRDGSDPNSLRLFNSILRLSLDHNTTLTIAGRSSYALGTSTVSQRVTRLHFERFIDGLKSFDTSVLNDQTREWLERLIKKYDAIVKGWSSSR